MLVLSVQEFLKPSLFSLLLVGMSGCSTSQVKKQKLSSVEKKIENGKTTAVIKTQKTGILHFPRSANENVRHWVRFFTGRGKKTMQKSLSRASEFLPRVQEVLKEEGIPAEIAYVALIESGYRSIATSRAKAVGFWQFMKPTAKGYGLKVNRLVDERRDLEASTRAAAKYLKSLYYLFGSWPLALSAYNLGENRLKYVIMKNQVRDFWKISEKKLIPRETRNYYPKLIAAIEIAEAPELFGLKVEPRKPLEAEQVLVSKKISIKELSKRIGVSAKELKRLNPAYLSDRVPATPSSLLTLNVPKNYRLRVIGALPLLPVLEEKKMRFYHASTHRVKRGDNLTQIARRYKVSIRELIRINKLNNRATIRVGMKLRLPQKNRSTDAAKQTRKSDRHKIQRGETLYSIARKYKVSLAELMKVNELKPRMKISFGKFLRIPKKIK